MTIGVPKEIMKKEGRVGITPEGVTVLVRAQHKVLVQSNAGKESGYQDEDYLKAGAEIAENPKEIYMADMVVKVKEPRAEEYELLKEGGIIFGFLHLPDNPKLAEILREKNIVGIAYEGVQLENKERPILKTMSEVAGKSAIFEGMHYLRKEVGGKGILIEDATVVVVGGAGIVGQSAVKTALALGAKVIALDLPGRLPPSQSDNYICETSTPENIEKRVKKADLLVGAVAIPGGKAVKLVTRKMVSSMEPGSVIIDVAIDEGGAIETSVPTNHEDPVFTDEGVIHYCVKNMPGAVSRTSTRALAASSLPYTLEIANKGFEKAIKENPAIAKGVHIYKGKITHPKLAEDLGKEYTPLENLL